VINLADTIYIKGESALIEIGFQGESSDKTHVSTAATPTVTLAYLQSMNITPNENVTSNRFVGVGAGGRSRVSAGVIKKNHECTANMSFWVAKDLNQTTPMGVWLLKMPIDSSDTEGVGDPADTNTVPDTADEYGDDDLMTMTIEAGYVGSTVHLLTGCIVNRATFHAEEKTECLWTYEMLVHKAEKATAFSVGTLVEATEYPFTWGDVQVKYGDAGAAAAFDNVRMIEFIIENNIDPLYDLNNVASTRYLTGYIPGLRNITGTMRIDLTTATENGQDLWEDFYNDASGTATPTEGVVLKDIIITLYQSADYSIVYTLHDVVIQDLPDDIVGSGVPQITVGFTATNVVLAHKTLAAAEAPTGWREST